MKPCTKCKIVKPFDLFPRRTIGPKSDKSGRDSWCRECHKIKAKERRADPIQRARQIASSKRWQQNNPEKFKAAQRRRDLRLRHGITVEDYDKMFAEQNGLCAICGRPPDTNGPRNCSTLMIDHDHETGVIRGLVHNTCNLMLGYAEDNPAFLISGAQYIMRHKKLKLVS